MGFQTVLLKCVLDCLPLHPPALGASLLKPAALNSGRRDCRKDSNLRISSSLDQPRTNDKSLQTYHLHEFSKCACAILGILSNVNYFV